MAIAVANARAKLEKKVASVNARGVEAAKSAALDILRGLLDGEDSIASFSDERLKKDEREGLFAILFGMLKQAVKRGDTVTVSTPGGDSVAMSVDDCQSIMETLSILSFPEEREKVIEGLNTPIEQCVPASKVVW